MARVGRLGDDCSCQWYYANESKCELISAIASIPAMFISPISALLMIGMLFDHADYPGGYYWVVGFAVVAFIFPALAIGNTRRAKYWKRMRWEEHQTPLSSA